MSTSDTPADPVESGYLRSENDTQNTTAVVVRLPRDLRTALKLRADEEDRSLASLLRRAAKTYLASAAQDGSAQDGGEAR